MVQEAPQNFGSIRVYGTTAELESIRTWATELELDFTYRDLYDKFGDDRVWSFEFSNKESFVMFYLTWKEYVQGQYVNK